VSYVIGGSFAGSFLETYYTFTQILP
jgi:hypothetical protein